MPKELYLEGAEQIAEVKAMAQIGGIIQETGCRNAGEALHVLESRARIADTRAAVLLEQLKAALITVGPQIEIE
jgi:hypothetical protein